MINLLDAQKQKALRIVRIAGGTGVRRQLQQLDLRAGSTILVKRSAPLSGPLVVESNGSDIVIGRGIASKIEVEEVK